jgi:hypothetical protein
MVVIGKPFDRMRSGDNRTSLSKIVEFINQHGPQSRQRLALLVKDHIHGTKTSQGGDSVVRYFIKNGWLKEIL